MDNHILKPSEEVSNSQDTFFKGSPINQNLTSRISSISELKTYIRVKFGSYRIAGVKASISSGRIKQILNGFYLPKSPDLIKQIARGWEIDATNLALIFANCKKEVKNG